MTKSPKLLAVCNSFGPHGHDHNISYYDGEVHYLKVERVKGIKKYAFKDDGDIWDTVFDTFGVVPSELDAIAYVGEPIGVEAFKVNHHLAHYLSAMEDCPIGMVIDGISEDGWWSYFVGDYCCANGGNDLSGPAKGSIGEGLIYTGRKMGLQGHDLDLAGKLMSLQSYGKVNQELLEKFRSMTINEMFSMEDFDGLDWLATVHKRCGEIVLRIFDEFVLDSNSKIVYSGGVAQNIVWNTELRKRYPNLIIPPHCGDEGLSLGALQWLRKELT